jgi:biopolymer transport protein ExbD
MAGFAAGHSGSLVAEPNVTPMIDVLLVLLIVFMLSVRVRHVIETNVPPISTAATGPAPPQIVLELLPGQGYAINGQPVSDQLLEATLGQIYTGRPVKLIYIKAAPDRTYQEVITAMDRSRGAGVQVIGIVPR